MKASRTLVATESPLIPVQPPLTKIKRFWCKDAPFVGYEIIENKEIVLSPRQLTIKSVKKPDQVAVEFIKANNLSSREVTLPNRSKITAYPLCTVVAYWSYLNSFGLLPEHEKKVLAALISGEEIKEEKAYLRENGSRVAPTPVEIIDHPVPLAKVVKVEILEGTELSIFVIDDRSRHQFWIEETEGLSIIKASPTALIEQTGEARREEYLKKKKCSMTRKTCFQERDGKVFKVHIRPFYDWIRIWQYFGNQKNSRALSLLAELAMCNIETRLGAYQVESKPAADPATAFQISSLNGKKKATAA